MTARCALYIGALNFRDSLTTPTATISNIFHGLLFRYCLELLADDFPVNSNSLIKASEMFFTEEDKTFIKIFVADYGLWTTETNDRVPWQSITRKLCYRKDDRAMYPIHGCPENFRDSLTTPTATVPNIFHRLWFGSTL